MPPRHAAILVRLPVPTSAGEFIAGYSAKGLAELRFPTGKNSATHKAAAKLAAEVRRWHRLTTAAVQAVASGVAPRELPSLDVSVGTDFQQRVWAALRHIKLGRTQSYGAIAESMGKPKASRAVGAACGANPIPLLIPCHRVLAASGKIGGFSGGLDWKRKLLAQEKVAVA